MSNFSVLSEHDEQLLRLGMLAEKYFAEDPNTCLLKLRQLTELLSQLLAARAGLLVAPEETQFQLLRRLQDSGVLPRELYQMFDEVRRAGNAASHALSGDHRSALTALKLTWQLGLWFHRKRKNIDVSSSLQQAKRYSRTFTPSTEVTLPPENWGDGAAYRIPFAFSANGRPFLRQLATKSGIWFCDLRRADNLGHPLDGWYTPDGL